MDDHYRPPRIKLVFDETPETTPKAATSFKIRTRSVFNSPMNAVAATPHMTTMQKKNNSYVYDFISNTDKST